MLIYLVEDDNSIRELVAYTLHSAGFEAEGFERPSAFWRACAERRPDLVLLDLMLPEEDGISILKKLRQAPETARLPILLLTAKATTPIFIGDSPPPLFRGAESVRRRLYKGGMLTGVRDAAAGRSPQVIGSIARDSVLNFLPFL